MHSVQLGQISWEAVATFSTGILAVFAAVYVGLRQTSISKALAGLEERKLREALFDRRFAFLDGFNRYAERIVDEESVSRAEFEEFLVSARQSRLLFSSDVYACFTAAREAIERFSNARRDAEARTAVDGLEMQAYRKARTDLQAALTQFNDKALKETRLAP